MSFLLSCASVEVKNFSLSKLHFFFPLTFTFVCHSFLHRINQQLIGYCALTTISFEASPKKNNNHSQNCKKSNKRVKWTNDTSYSMKSKLTNFGRSSAIVYFANSCYRCKHQIKKATAFLYKNTFVRYIYSFIYLWNVNETAMSFCVWRWHLPIYPIYVF